MRISVFGLGYVGCVTAACLARDGHEVVGVDINRLKTELVGSGRSPVVEPGLDALVADGVRSGRLTVGCDSAAAVHATDISLICVGTPSAENGSLDLRYVEHVCQEIATALATKTAYHVVVVRSTVLPTTVSDRLIPLVESHSAKRAGVDFGVCMHPEFLREGSAIRDYDHPSLIVIGELDERSGETLAQLYETFDVQVTRTNLTTAETVKYACNAFHALKVTFANEIGNFCKAHDVDGQRVMEIFCQDQQLNISPVYLRPGFAFGGSCLPKDLRALLYRAKQTDVDCPVLSAILLSNQRQVDLGIRLVERTGKKRVGVLGLSFKAGTDDLRESPAISLAETLLGRGYAVKIFDEELQLERLVGANKLFLEREIPHIASLLCSSLHDLVAHAEVLVVTNGSRRFLEVSSLMNRQQSLIDLSGTLKEQAIASDHYTGICW